jgi:hypothetical protein
MTLPLPDSLIDNKPSTGHIQMPAHWLVGVFQDWFEAHAEEFFEHVLANEGVHLRLGQTNYDTDTLVVERDDHPFVSPFFGSSWIEGTHKAYESRKIRIYEQVFLEPGQQFIYRDQVYTLHAKNFSGGLPSAHQLGHETGVLYIFHPSELPDEPCTPDDIAMASVRYLAERKRLRELDNQPETVRVALADSSTFHRVNGDGYVFIGNNDTMVIDTAQTATHHSHNGVYPELVLYSKNERRRIAIHMSAADWMEAIGRLFDRIKKYERTPK